MFIFVSEICRKQHWFFLNDNELLLQIAGNSLQSVVQALKQELEIHHSSSNKHRDSFVFAVCFYRSLIFNVYQTCLLCSLQGKREADAKDTRKTGSKTVEESKVMFCGLEIVSFAMYSGFR